MPEGFYERPDRLWVIPVVFTPVDQLNSVPDPSHRGVTLGGAPLTAIVQSRWEAARANVFAQLRVVQAVYEDRLQDPNTGASRGSFGIASWNPASKQVEVLSPGDPDGRPQAPRGRNGIVRSLLGHAVR